MIGSWQLAVGSTLWERLVGAKLARDDRLLFNSDVDRHTAIASKLCSQNFTSNRGVDIRAVGTRIKAWRSKPQSI